MVPSTLKVRSVSSSELAQPVELRPRPRRCPASAARRAGRSAADSRLLVEPERTRRGRQLLVRPDAGGRTDRRTVGPRRRARAGRPPRAPSVLFVLLVSSLVALRTSSSTRLRPAPRRVAAPRSSRCSGCQANRRERERRKRQESEQHAARLLRRRRRSPRARKAGASPVRRAAERPFGERRVRNASALDFGNARR